ncbi:MAG: SLOG family protein [Candidatus Limnocylindrales bacterium]
MSRMVLVSGSRTFPSPELVKDRIRTALTPGDHLMHGCARGVDTWAEEAARSVGATILRRPADWDRYGTRAGLLRNADMFEEACRADDVRILIFWDGRSRGTKNMIDRCVAAGMPHEIIRPDSASS